MQEIQTQNQGQPVTTPPPQAPNPDTQAQVEAPKGDPGKQPDDLSRRFAHLSKKEKSIVRAKRELAAREEAIRAQEERLRQADRWEKLSSEPVEAKVAALKDLGLSYDEILSFQLNGEQPTPEQLRAEVKREIEALKEEQKALDAARAKQAEAQAKAQYEAVRSEVYSEVDSLTKADPQSFECINAFGSDAKAAVWAYMELAHKRSGKLVSVEEAAKAVEGFYEEQAQKVLGLNKIKSRLGANPEAQKLSTNQKPLTLTNQLSASQSPAAITPEERRRRAMAAFLGQEP